MASHLDLHHIDMFSAPFETDVKGRAVQPIQAILFDMDGTLVDSERVSQAAWKLAARDLGFELPDALIQSFIGRTAPSVHALVANHLHGDEALAEECFRLHHVHFDRICETDLALMPGAREALEQLSAAGYPLALATSTYRAKAVPRLERFGLRDMFVTMTTGDEIENGKPAPDIFLLSAERMGVEPANCAVIEDSHNGVRSGHAAGARVFMIPDMVPPTSEIEAMCTAILGSLHELPAAIAAVNG